MIADLVAALRELDAACGVRDRLRVLRMQLEGQKRFEAACERYDAARSAARALLELAEDADDSGQGELAADWLTARGWSIDHAAHQQGETAHWYWEHPSQRITLTEAVAAEMADQIGHIERARECGGG